MAGTTIVHRRPHASGRVRPQRRKLVWATRSVASQVVASGAKFNHDLLTNLEVSGASVLGATVMRTHMDLIVTWTSTDTSLGAIFGFIVSTAPTATNIDPSVDFGDDWALLRNMTPANSDNTTLNGTAFTGARTTDLRSKRKVEELNDKYFFCFTNVGSGSVTIGYFCRTLLALP